MKRFLYEISIGTVCLGIVVLCLGYGFQLGYNAASKEYPSVVEQHTLCYDTDKYEAWVARKEGITRCFMEFRQYPHRVRASHIDE